MAAMMVFAASCVKETSTETFSDNIHKYNLTIDQPTKTELSGTGSKRQVSWNSGDAIKYYTESGQSGAVSATVNIDGSSTYVEIPRGRTDEFINAVFGATQLKSSTSTESIMNVTSRVKNTQSYTSFAQAHLCAAFSDDLENPYLQFHNASAVLKFTSSSVIKKVVFHGNNDEIITGGSNGDLKITYIGGAFTTEAASTGGTSVTVQTNGADADFYIAILPVTFTKGITVDCYDESLDLIVSQKTNATINTLSSSGTPKIINLGSVMDWMANPQPVAVDLGLSVKWARYNVGATSPEEYGDYFSWGEIAPKNEYKWGNYSYGTSKNGPFSEYVLDPAYGTVDHKTVLDLEDDAAHAAWGDDWRMPSREEFDELKNNCTWTWTEKNGVKGYCVTSNISGYTGNSIFLPANGMISGVSSSDVGTIGNYWSASVSDENTYHAISPYFSSSYVKSGNCHRCFGLGIRPVQGAVVPVSGIDVSSKLELIIGKTATLFVSVRPENATYKNVTWASSDESIATIDATGKVTAVSIGLATITVYSVDASTTATCEVTVKEPDYNGHEYVDLGLPSGLKWATWNVGASAPEEYGDYFAWGEIGPKSDYSWLTYKFRVSGVNYGNVKFNKYCTDNKTTLDQEDDAAHVNWGGCWRMPTNSEWNELQENCCWTWTAQNGVKGRLVTSKTNSNSIFLPAAGFRGDTNLYDTGSDGYYWSSSGSASSALWVTFGSDNVYTSSHNSCLGSSVRAVHVPESVSLDSNSLSLHIGESEQLKAIVYLNNSTNLSVTWSSNDTGVAAVNDNGLVTAVASGTAIITVTTNDRGYSATCQVTVVELPKINGHEYVDLGLSSGVKWATCNVGASKPKEFGDYFSWGETEPKDDYSVSTYKWCNGDWDKLTKYCTDSSSWESTEPMDNKSKLDPEDDAAHVNWGGCWRMPTDEEWTELRVECTWTWVTQNGVNGRLVTGSNGNSIFLPAAGSQGPYLSGVGSYGHYDSSSLDTHSPHYSYGVLFASDDIFKCGNPRGYGNSVRPVYPKE